MGHFDYTLAAAEDIFFHNKTPARSLFSIGVERTEWNFRPNVRLAALHHALQHLAANPRVHHITEIVNFVFTSIHAGGILKLKV